MTAAKAFLSLFFYANFFGKVVGGLRYLGSFAIINNAVIVHVGSGLIVIF